MNDKDKQKQEIDRRIAYEMPRIAKYLSMPRWKRMLLALFYIPLLFKLIKTRKMIKDYYDIE